MYRLFEKITRKKPVREHGLKKNYLIYIITQNYEKSRRKEKKG